MVGDVYSICGAYWSPFNNHYHREKGIKYRKDEAIGGWFSQIGIMHQVHHMWGEPLLSVT